MYGDIDVKPYFDFVAVYYNIKFDANGGEFTQSMNYSATNGMVVEKGETLSQEWIKLLEPTKKALQDVEYIFDGWEYNGVVGITAANEDRTYVARWKTVQRKYPLTVYANGYYNDSANNFELVEIPGTFGSSNVIYYPADTYDNIMSLITQITNGNLIANPISLDDGFNFSKWRVSILPDHMEIRAEYQKAGGLAKAIIELGAGSIYNGTGTIEAYEPVIAGNKYSFKISQYIEPNNYERVYEYNDDWSRVQIMACYKDDNYYYTFTGWSLDGGASVADEETLIELGPGESCRLTAIYQQHKLQKFFEFRVDNSVGVYEELWLNGTKLTNTYVYTAIGFYEEQLPADKIPVAVKKIDSFDIDSCIWEYVFLHWECVETGESFVKDFTDDFTYRPVFEKRLRTVTVTLDAGENGYFESNGSRYIEIKMSATTVCEEWEFEVPVHNDENLGFFEWNHFFPFSFYTSGTVEARYYNTQTGEIYYDFLEW